MLKKMPILMLLLVISTSLLSKFIPFQIQEILYTISSNVKSILSILLPFVVFSLLFNSMSKTTKNVSKLLSYIFITVICSGVIALLICKYVSEASYHQNLSIIEPKSTMPMNSLWNLPFNSIFSNTHGMICGILFGIICGKAFPQAAQYISNILNIFLKNAVKLISLIIPFFIIGVILKLQNDDAIRPLAQEYSGIMLYFICSVFSYLFIIFLCINNFNIMKTIQAIKNLVPAIISAISTTSSIATIPFTISGTQKNVCNKHIPETTIPITTNMHLIGDWFVIPILSYAVLKSFGHVMPSNSQYLIFLCSFIVYSFAIACGPGGGILILMTVLEKQFGFNKDMISMITALYILFDPIITAANVLGNSAFAMFIDKAFKKTFKQPCQEEISS